jgi:hypothetical protein
VIHRHLRPGAEDTATAIEDVLENGDVGDWSALARRVRADPWGPAAQSLRLVLAHRHIYGTTALWRNWLSRLEAK